MAESLWAQHYSYYNLRKSWTSFTLRGYDAYDPQFIIKPSEMSKSWKNSNSKRLMARPAWTNISESFPETMKVIESLGFTNLDRVRFMRLAGGGELSRHADVTDRDAGVLPGRVSRLHIPITTNPTVRFYSWDARGVEIVRTFGEGDLFYLDQRKPHRVTNTGDDRVHLVVDVFSDDRLRAMVAKAAEPDYEDLSSHSGKFFN